MKPFYALRSISFLDFRKVYLSTVLMKTAPLCFYAERPERNQRGVVPAAWLQRSVPQRWDEGPGTEEEEEESVPSWIWPARLCVTPGQTRQAPLTLRRSSPHSALLNSARTRTSRIHAARTQNGDGREPEQPVRRGLPPRPLVTVENFIFQTACRITHLRWAIPHRCADSRNLCLLGSEFPWLWPFYSLSFFLQ